MSRRDYSEYVSRMSYGDLVLHIEEIGKEKFRGPLSDNYLLMSALCCEKYKRDQVEKEFLSRKKISRFKLMEL